MNNRFSPPNSDDAREDNQEAGKERVASGGRGRSRTTQSTRQQNDPANLASSWQDSDLLMSTEDKRLQPISNKSVPITGSSTSYRALGSPASTSSRTLAPPSRSLPPVERAAAANTPKPLSPMSLNVARSTHSIERRSGQEVVERSQPHLSSSSSAYNLSLILSEQSSIPTLPIEQQKQKNKSFAPRSSIHRTLPESTARREERETTQIFGITSMSQSRAADDSFSQPLFSVQAYTKEKTDHEWIPYCRHAFRVTNPVVHKQTIKSKHSVDIKRYCAKIRENEDYCKWINSSKDQNMDRNIRLFWLFGIEATSNMTVALIDALESRPAVVAYYFPYKGEAPSNKAVSVLQGLIYQLVDTYNDLWRYLKDDWDQSGPWLFDHESKFALQTLWNILVNMVDALKPTRVYLVIDSIHKWDYDLHDFLDLIAGHCEESHNVRWCIATNDYDPWIVERLRELLRPGWLQCNMKPNRQEGPNRAHKSRAKSSDRRSIHVDQGERSEERPKRGPPAHKPVKNILLGGRAEITEPDPEDREKNGNVKDGRVERLQEEGEGRTDQKREADGISSPRLSQMPYLQLYSTSQQHGTDTKNEKLNSLLALYQRPTLSDSKTSLQWSIEKGAETLVSKAESNNRQHSSESSLNDQNRFGSPDAEPVSEQITKQQPVPISKRSDQQDRRRINGAKRDREKYSEERPTIDTNAPGHRSRRKVDGGNPVTEHDSNQQPASLSTARPGPGDSRKSGKTSPRKQTPEKPVSDVTQKKSCCVIM